MARKKKSVSTPIEDVVLTPIENIMYELNPVQDNIETITIGDGDNAVNVNIKKKLSITERSELVNSIVDMMWFNEGDANELKYVPYFRKFAFEFNILNYFTDIKLPDSVESIWNLLQNTNLVNMITEHIETEYLKSIIQETNELIEYRKLELSKHSKLDNILISISDILSVIKNKTDNLDMDSLIKLAKEYSPEFSEQLERMLSESIKEVSAE